MLDTSVHEQRMMLVRAVAVIGQIVTAAVLLGVIAMIAALSGHVAARDAAVISLALTTGCYVVQVPAFKTDSVREFAQESAQVLLVLSWVTGVAALALLLLSRS